MIAHSILWKTILLIFIMVFQAVLATRLHVDPASEQLVMFRNQDPIGILSTSAGAPVNFKDASNTLNTRLILNEYLMDSLSHFLRERISERVVHSKAVGAIGYFEVTHNITNICRAKLFSNVGKKTKIIVRFSPALQIRGGNDVARGPRGFATKFYSEDGIFDIVAVNTPVYAYKDPNLFTAFTHSQNRNPATNLDDPNSIWDFLTLQPESLYMHLLVFGDYGIPDGYRHMPGFSIHTYQVENEDGDIYFVRFHIMPAAGIKNLLSDQASCIQSVDPDYFTRDLYNAIETGNFPSWTLSIQVLTLKEVIDAGSYVFDVTRILPLDKYPLRPVGNIVLNKNVLNHFAEVEQIAYNPANLVPGILGAPDNLFEARRLAYREAQSYRLGSNNYKISVNCPFEFNVFTYNRDGRPPVRNNENDSPNYYPNSFNGPIPYVDKKNKPLIEIIEGEPDNLQQATAYVNNLSDDEIRRLVDNILFSLRPVVNFIQDRAVKLFTLIHPDLGQRIARGLLITPSNETFTC